MSSVSSTRLMPMHHPSASNMRTSRHPGAANGPSRSDSVTHGGGPSTLDSQLAAIVEFSNDAIYSRTLDGTVVTWNKAAERMFGFAANEILGRSSRVLLPRDRWQEYNQLIKRMRLGQKVQHFETDRLRKDRTRLQVSLTLSPIWDDSGQLAGISTVARDITEQRRMQQALAHSERELTDLFEQASIGLMWVSPAGVILRANHALISLLQCRSSQCVGRRLRRFHADPSYIDQLLMRLRNRESMRNLPMDLRTAAGESRPALVDANALWDRGRFIHTRWFVRDISQRKRLEQEILELSERERRSFAQELHDGLGQQLGGIAYLANVLHAQLLERRAPEADEAARIFVLVRNAIEQTRRLARGLSPIRADPEGLVDALRELAAHTREVFGLACNMTSPKGLLVHDPVLAGHLYRIAQEAVNNAVKHAGARRVDIRLRRTAGEVTLTVCDDGRGISNPPARRSGLGLRIMQYRADLVRGRLKVGPRPARRGTEVRCIAPHAPVQRRRSTPTRSSYGQPA